MFTVNLPDCIKHKLQLNEPMRKHSSIGIGGRALYYIQVNSVQELKTVMHYAEAEGITVFMLGGGTNILISDKGLDGIVIKCSGTDFNTVAAEGNTVTAGSACSLPNLVRTTTKMGIGGLECMTGIPGSVGGALIMNAGGRYGTISEFLEEVTVLNSRHELQVYTKDELAFSYRSSSFVPGEIILSARFNCYNAPVAELTEKKEIIVSEKAKTQPLGERSCGCIFKNPEGQSAGDLIDRVGFKGKRTGEIEVSSMHANYLINKGKGLSRDMMSLMDSIYKKVEEEFEIKLEIEIKLWGDCGWMY